jgi:hypothetical protein
MLPLVHALHHPHSEIKYAPFVDACDFRRVKPLNDGHTFSPELKAIAEREAPFASPFAQARSKRSKKAGRGMSTDKQQKGAPADQTLILTRKFRRMSKVHDRIRMQVLAASVARAR